MVRLPKDERPTPLRDGLRFYDLRYTCPSLLIAQPRTSRRSRRSSGMRARASRSTPTGTCFRPRSTPSGPPGWSATPPWPGWDGPSTNQRTTAGEKQQVDDPVLWRRLRGSNPSPGCYADRGWSGGPPVTCDPHSPSVTAPARWRPAVPHAVRTQHGPATLDYLAWVHLRARRSLVP
jgi:hypothetical protein